MRWNHAFAAPCAVMLAGLAAAATPWHLSLSYDGGGYWALRVPVEVHNSGDAPLAGAAVRLRLAKTDETGPLIGCRVSALRAVNAAGEEILYDVVDGAGEPKRDGALAEGDSIILPAEVPAKGSATLYVYADNGSAWAVADWLATGLANGGFERGDAAPAQWNVCQADATHRLSYSHEGARTGSACARCDVDPGATPAWVCYAQQVMAVEPGRKYRFTAWVRAEGVQGKAGWYVHVDGQQPLMINSVAAWDGTFDWRKAEIEFVVPNGGRTCDCGTVLHGTGTAWYDDAVLELVDDNAFADVKVLPAEPMRLQAVGASADWPADAAWAWRAPMRIRNFTDAPLNDALFTCDVRAFQNALAKVLGFRTKPALMLVDSDAAGAPLPINETTGGDLNLVGSVPAKTEKTLWLYAAKDAPPSAASRVLSTSEWVGNAQNLVTNGDMEQGEDAAPTAWISGKEGHPENHSFEARRVQGGVSGSWCLELQVPQGAGAPDWVGWRQKVPVEPSRQYMLSGYMKLQGLEGDTAIYVHVLRRDGSTIDALNLAATPFITGDKDWTRVETTFATPEDCGFVEIHLTTNRRGTVWHDAVMLAETRAAVAGTIAARSEVRTPQAWPVNTLVKVFQSDLPPEASGARDVRVYAARNSWESFQVAVRVPADAAPVLNVAPWHGLEGMVPEPPEIYRVGYVPIDFPVGYHNTTAPVYKRFVPASRGNDGWAGWWPDPLEAMSVEHTERGVHAALPLKANATQPIWFCVHVPADATPGTYTSELTVGDIALPIHLTVWNFTMPDEKRLPALYDLRGGPLGDFLAGPERKETIRTWQRFLARYNVSPSMILDEPVFGYENGHVTMRTDDFDEEAHNLLDTLHVNKVYAPLFFYACGWAYEPKDIFGLKAFTPEYVAAWKEAYKLFFDHVTEKGWRKHFVFYLADEPFEKSERTIAGLVRLSDMAREIAPDIPVYSSTWTDIQGLEGHLSQWGIGVHGSFPLARTEPLRAAGDHFWFTTDGHMCTDTPLLAIERLLPWFCFRYGVEGYEFWGVSWWTNNPWQCGWHQYIGQSDEGQKFYHVRYPNGDGFLTYPPRTPNEGPVPSIRLMAACAGVYDYEIFAALQRYAGAGDAGAQAVVEKVRAATPAVPNAGGRFSTLLMPDPDAVQEARVAAGETVSALAQRHGP